MSSSSHEPVACTDDEEEQIYSGISTTITNDEDNGPLTLTTTSPTTPRGKQQQPTSNSDPDIKLTKEQPHLKDESVPQKTPNNERRSSILKPVSSSSLSTYGRSKVPGETAGGSLLRPGATPRSLNNKPAVTPLQRFLQRTAKSRTTPRSRITTTSLTSSTPSAVTPGVIQDQRSVIAALVEGRGLARGEIGIASIDIKEPELVLSQFPDNASYAKIITKLQVLDPIEIVMPNTACENGNMATIFKQIIAQLPNSQISLVPRKYFNEKEGHRCVKHLCVPEYNTVFMEIKSKYYCLATAAALLKYLESAKNIIYAQVSLKVVFRGIDKTVMIDATTAKNLELILNLKKPKSNETLYGILNYTKTFGGARLLRANVLQPPSDEDTINTRLDCITELVNNQNMFFNIQAVLGRLLDVGGLLTFCIQVPRQESIKVAENKITNVIKLKHTLQLVPQLRSALENSQHVLFHTFCQLLEDERYELILEKIRAVIHDDTRYEKGQLNMKTQKCFAVKANINGLLDIARRTYTENVDDVAELVKQLSEKHGLPLRTGYSATRGFFIKLSTSKDTSFNMNSLHHCFIKKIRTGNTITCTTEDLIKLNERINQSLSEIYCMSNVIITGLVEDVRSLIGCLYKLSEVVCTMDMLLSLAHTCSINDYVRPELTDTLAIKQGRNPILKKILVDEPISNDTFMSEENNFSIVTGPNMSGKSTYLKQVAIMQIMAQMGSFVPAQYASFRVADQIFSRIGNSDDMEANCSTLMVEMKETNYILQNLTDKSLVIIDELGRGTSLEEGIGISWAVSEAMLTYKAFVIFATHFRELSQLDMYPNVSILQMSVHQEETNDGIFKDVFTYQIDEGFTSAKHYGLRRAEISNLPQEIVQDAKALAENLENQSQGMYEMRREYAEEKKIVSLANKLRQAARNSNTSEENTRQLLKKLQSTYKESIAQSQDQCIQIQLPEASEE